jgi:hypothetical protein
MLNLHSGYARNIKTIDRLLRDAHRRRRSMSRMKPADPSAD